MDGVRIEQPLGWRLLVSGAGDPAANMALDAAMLDMAVRGLVGPTVRVYTWREAAVSVGRFQDVRSTLHTDALLRRSVPVVRRPTGGRGVLHGGDLTVSVAARLDSIRTFGAGVLATHRALMGAIVRALGRFGVRAEVGSGMHHAAGGDCFVSSCGADVVAGDGTKLAGGAQRRVQNCLLEQVSIKWCQTVIEPHEVFVGPGSASAYPLADIPEEAMVAAVVAGFEETLSAELERGTLSETEVSETRLRIPKHIVDLSALM